MNSIYLDNNATTPMLPAVWDAMLPYLGGQFGNSSSSHQFGRRARQALEDAREQIASLFDANSDEVIITSCATEANNLALFGLTSSTPGAVAVSDIEHPSVLEPIRQLMKSGYRRGNLPVTMDGSIDLTEVELADDVRLAAVMLANHETGAIQPVAELAERLSGKAPLHCDAAAAAGKMPISFRRLGATSMTISAHKFHGPKGIGALILRRGQSLRPLHFGGHQQQGKRPGTEPVALAVGMAKALEHAVQNMDHHRQLVCELRRRFLEQLQPAAPLIVNGPESDGVPHVMNISFPGCQADALLMSLDLAGLACSTGSACSSGSLLPSPVLAAMGVGDDRLHSAMRFSLSPLLSIDEVDEAARRVVRCVDALRHKSPDLD